MKKVFMIIQLCNMPQSCSALRWYCTSLKGAQNHPELKVKEGPKPGGGGGSVEGGEKALGYHHLSLLII